MDIKIDYSYSLRDIAYEISYKRIPVIQRVFRKFMTKIIYKIITEGYQFKIPYNMGTLHLIATKEPALNIQETIKQKKRIFYKNDDTLGYGYKMRWTVPFNMPNKKVNKYKIGYKTTKIVANLIQELKKQRKLPVAFETRN